MLFSFLLNAQLNFKKGYIVNNANDTLYGLINDGGTISNTKVCLFKPNRNANTTKFTPDEIKAYRFTNDKYYCTKEIFYKGENRKYFLEVLIAGKMNLYYFWKNKEESYFIQSDTDSLIGLANVNLYQKNKSNISDRWYNLPFYTETLITLFSDSKNTVHKLNGVDYQREDLVNITKDYIIETCGYCTSYEKDLSKDRDRLGLIAGVRFSQNSLRDMDTVIANYNTAFPIGFLYNFPLPLITERLSFQFEVVALNLIKGTTINNNNPKKENTEIALPLLIKYEVPFGVFSPSFAIGKESMFEVESSFEFDRFSVQRGGWFCELGAEYKIAPKFSVFSNFRYMTNNYYIRSDITKKIEEIPYQSNNVIQMQVGVKF
jgi:hypothetical protein